MSFSFYLLNTFAYASPSISQVCSSKLSFFSIITFYITLTVYGESDNISLMRTNFGSLHTIRSLFTIQQLLLLRTVPFLLGCLFVCCCWGVFCGFFFRGVSNGSRCTVNYKYNFYYCYINFNADKKCWCRVDNFLLFTRNSSPIHICCLPFSTNES